VGETTEDLKAEDLRLLVEDLRAEVQRLKDRPPMGCYSCEQFNEKLADELDAIKRFSIQEERKNLAMNSWLASWAHSHGIDLLQDYLDKKHHKEVIDAFEKWWETNRDIQ
jgi:hypothetical protein